MIGRQQNLIEWFVVTCCLQNKIRNTNRQFNLHRKLLTPSIYPLSIYSPPLMQVTNLNDSMINKHETFQNHQELLTNQNLQTTQIPSVLKFLELTTVYS